VQLEKAGITGATKAQDVLDRIKAKAKK